MERSIPEKNPVAWQQWFGILLVFSLLGGTAAARIGETETEVTVRYGDPIFTLSSKAEASLTKCYLSGGFSIAVTYVGGRSAREMLAKADKSGITEKEIHRLLEANAGGSSWNAQQLAGQKNVPDGLFGWRTDDERPRVALYDERTQAFFVTTQRFINQTNATNQRNAARKINGRESFPGGLGERWMRNFQNGNLLGGRGQPTSSPARKAEAGK